MREEVEGAGPRSHGRGGRVRAGLCGDSVLPGMVREKSGGRAGEERGNSGETAGIGGRKERECAGGARGETGGNGEGKTSGMVRGEAGMAKGK